MHVAAPDSFTAFLALPGVTCASIHTTLTLSPLPIAAASVNTLLAVMHAVLMSATANLKYRRLRRARWARDCSFLGSPLNNGL